MMCAVQSICYKHYSPTREYQKVSLSLSNDIYIIKYVSNYILLNIYLVKIFFKL